MYNAASKYKPMNLQFAAISLIALLSINLSAQEFTEGFQLGIYYSQMRSSSEISMVPFVASGPFEFSHSPSLSLGFSFHHRLLKQLSFESGISFERRTSRVIDYSVTFGSDFNNGGPIDIYNSSIENTLRLNYIGIPIKLRQSLFRIGKSRIQLSGGVLALALLNARAIPRIIESGGPKWKAETKSIDRQRIKQVNSALTVGLASIIEFKNFQLSIQPFYEWLPSAIAEKEIDDSIQSFGIRTNISLSNSKLKVIYEKLIP